MSDATFLLRERARHRRPAPTGASASVSISARRLREIRRAAKRDEHLAGDDRTAAERLPMAGRSARPERCARTTVRPSAIRIAAVSVATAVAREGRPRRFIELESIDRRTNAQENES